MRIDSLKADSGCLKRSRIKFFTDSLVCKTMYLQSTSTFSWYTWEFLCQQINLSKCLKRWISCLHLPLKRLLLNYTPKTFGTSISFVDDDKKTFNIRARETESCVCFQEKKTRKKIKNAKEAETLCRHVLTTRVPSHPHTHSPTHSPTQPYTARKNSWMEVGRKKWVSSIYPLHAFTPNHPLPFFPPLKRIYFN